MREEWNEVLQELQIKVTAILKENGTMLQFFKQEGLMEAYQKFLDGRMEPASVGLNDHLEKAETRRKEIRNEKQEIPESHRNILKDCQRKGFFRGQMKSVQKALEYGVEASLVENYIAHVNLWPEMMDEIRIGLQQFPKSGKEQDQLKKLWAAQEEGKMKVAQVEEIRQMIFNQEEPELIALCSEIRGIKSYSVDAMKALQTEYKKGVSISYLHTLGENPVSIQKQSEEWLKKNEKGREEVVENQGNKEITSSYIRKERGVER